MTIGAGVILIAPLEFLTKSNRSVVGEEVMVEVAGFVLTLLLTLTLAFVIEVDVFVTLEVKFVLILIAVLLAAFPIFIRFPCLMFIV